MFFIIVLLVFGAFVISTMQLSWVLEEMENIDNEMTNFASTELKRCKGICFSGVGNQTTIHLITGKVRVTKHWLSVRVEFLNDDGVVLFDEKIKKRKYMTIVKAAIRLIFVKTLEEDYTCQENS